MREFKNILFVMALSLCVVALEGCGGSSGGGGGGSSGGSGGDTSGTTSTDTSGTTNTPPPPPLPVDDAKSNYARALRGADVNAVFPLQKEGYAGSDEAFLLSFRTKEYLKNGFLYDFLELRQFYARGITGKGITVGIWDSGFDPNVMGNDNLKERTKGIGIKYLLSTSEIVVLSIEPSKRIQLDDHRLKTYPISSLQTTLMTTPPPTMAHKCFPLLLPGKRTMVCMA